MLPAVIAHAKTILPTPEFKATPPLVLLPEAISDFLAEFLEDDEGRFFLRDHDDGDGRGTNTLIAPKGSISTGLMLLLLSYINDGTNPKEVRPPAAAEAETNDASKHETASKKNVVEEAIILVQTGEYIVLQNDSRKVTRCLLIFAFFVRLWRIMK